MFKKFAPFRSSKVFLFKDPDTAFVYKANTLHDLTQYIISYRQQNDLPPIDHLPDVLENYLCSLPQNQGACERAELKRGFMQWARGGIALLRYVVFKEKAPKAEADRRALICAKCPHNTFPDKKGFIKWADETAMIQTGGEQSTHNSLLGNCEVCSCNMRAKVFIKKENISLSERERTALPKFCWQIEE